jgi:hypothetical protein
LVAIDVGTGGFGVKPEVNKVFFSASYVVLALWMGCGLVILDVRLAKSGK